MRILLLTMLLLLPQLGAAQIYKTTDENGNVSYSDTPPSSGPSEEIRLREINSTPPPPSVDIPRQPTDDPGQQPDNSYRIAITSPPDETSIPMGPGNFSVSATVEPNVGNGELLQLLLDDSPWGEPQPGGNWALTNVFRGAHTVKVAVVDKEGKRLAESSPITVYVFRPSVNFKNRK